MPNLRPEQLAAELESRSRRSYLLHGNEPLLVEGGGDAIRAAAKRQGIDEREVLVGGPGFRWDRWRWPRQPVAVRRQQTDRPAHPSGKPGKDGGEAFAALRRQRRKRHRRPDQRCRSWTGPPARLRGFSKLRARRDNRTQRPARTAARLDRPQACTTETECPRSPEFIAEHVRGNLLAAHQEILKLGLLHAEGSLTSNRFAKPCSTSPATTSTSCVTRCSRATRPLRPVARGPARRGRSATADPVGAGERDPCAGNLRTAVDQGQTAGRRP